MTEMRRRRLARPQITRLQLADYQINRFCIPDAHGYCSTCADEAVPAKVLQIYEEMGTAIVEVSSQSSEVDISLIEEIYIGQILLIHGGVAIGALNPEQNE
jgi:hydrogenase maturation factor